jgi:hypothetical protein
MAYNPDMKIYRQYTLIPVCLVMLIAMTGCDESAITEPEGRTWLLSEASWGDQAVPLTTYYEAETTVRQTLHFSDSTYVRREFDAEGAIVASYSNVFVRDGQMLTLDHEDGTFSASWRIDDKTLTLSWTEDGVSARLVYTTL